MKLTTRCGEQAIAALNEELLATAVDARVVKTGKVRADTTVVSANVDYPTDTGLLARAVTRMSRLVRRIKTIGAAPRTPFRDRSRSAGRRVRSIAAHLRLRGAQAREEAQATIARITGQLAGLAGRTSTQAQAVLRNARRALPRTTGRAKGRLRRAVNEFAVLIRRSATVIAQARIRLAGGKPDSATRLVSLHDPDARPIVKGRLGNPSSSATRPRSSTTKTASSWTTPSNRATRPTRRNWHPRSNGSPAAPANYHARSPPTATTAKPPWKPTSMTPA